MLEALFPELLVFLVSSHKDHSKVTVEFLNSLTKIPKDSIRQASKLSKSDFEKTKKCKNSGEILRMLYTHVFNQSILIWPILAVYSTRLNPLFRDDLFGG
jgi:hypothetical protein